MARDRNLDQIYKSLNENDYLKTAASVFHDGMFQMIIPPKMYLISKDSFPESGVQTPYDFT